MKFGVIAEGCKITAVISDGIPMGDGCTVVESDLAADVILTECALIGGELVRVGPMPGPFMVYDPATGGWKDSRTLADLKAEKWAQSKAARDAQEFGPFSWGAFMFDGDAESKSRLSLAAMAAQAAIASGQGWEVDWTLADNSTVSLSAADVIGVVQAMGANITAAHQAARIKRAAIEAAATVEELDAI